MLRVVLFAGLMLSAVSASAQTQAPSSAPAISFDDGAPAAKEKRDRLICQTQKQIGSRLASKKICMTATQWKEHEQQVRSQLDQMHTTTQPAGGPG